MTTASKSSRNWMLAAGAAFLAVGAYAPTAFGADHRDSFAVDTEIEGDYTDAFGWPDPDRPGNIILAGMVNPFATPGLTASYRFSDTFLYQIQIDNNQANGAAADLVMQVQFSGTTTRSGSQPYRVFLGPATGSAVTTRLVPGAPGVVELCAQANGLPTSHFPGNATAGLDRDATGTVPRVTPNNAHNQDAYIYTGLNGQTSCYAGVADDSFITDATQAILRVGLNSNARSRTVPSLRTGQPLANYTTNNDNEQNHTQDLFRFATGDLIGGLRGRPLQLNGRSGVDTFGGFNGSLFAVSVPGSLLRGSGIPDQSRGGAINPDLIGTWGTVSRPANRAFNGYALTETGPFHQFERMGNQITATVFVFQQPMLDPTAGPNGAYRHLTGNDFAGTGVPVPAGTTPLATAVLKDLHNATGPENDIRLWDRMFPDSLTTTAAGQNNTGGGLLGGLLGGLSNLLIGGGNTVQARQAILTVLGFNSFGINGVPLYSGQFASFSNNQNRRLQAQMHLPDYLRINLNTTFDSAPGNSRPGAAAANNNSPTLALSQWGLQNGRRPADDVTDIVLRMTRETADVKFPDTLVLPGIANVVPGSGPRLSANGFARRAVNCEELNVAGGILNGGLIGNLVNGGVLGLLRPGESDGLLGRLSINVLTPCEDARVFLVLSGTDFIEPAADLANVATQNSEQQHLRTTFPYIGFNPLTGEAGTSGFSPTNP